MIMKRFTRLKGLGRYACLGVAVLNQLGRGSKFHNVQKGRSDYLLQLLADASVKCQPACVRPFLSREYIAPVIDQQVHICPDFAPEMILVDSFSDLTDQVFRHRAQGWKFCCNYQDLAHGPDFDEIFESLGLLNLGELEANYRRLLGLIEARWPGTPVVYLHFPDALEQRETFLTRAKIIREVVARCAADCHNFYSFSVPASVVKPPDEVEPGLKDFAYHYNMGTYAAFADMIRTNPVLRKLF